MAKARKLEEAPAGSKPKPKAKPKPKPKPRLEPVPPGPAPAAARPGDGRPDDDRPQRGSAGIAWLVAVVVATGGITAFYSARADLGEERVAHADSRVELATSRNEVSALQAKIAALEAERADLAAEAERKAEAIEEMRRTHEELQRRLEEEIAKGGVLISNQDGELIVDLLDKIVFHSGDAELNEQGRRVLEQVGQTLAEVPDKVIQITGHTDNLPISEKIADRFPSNWELSTARATNVVRFLQDEVGIPGSKLVASGVAEYRPIARNTSPAGRSRNRRIEVRLLQMAKK